MDARWGYLRLETIHLTSVSDTEHLALRPHSQLSGAKWTSDNHVVSDCSPKSWEKFWQAEHWIGPQENSDYYISLQIWKFGKARKLTTQKKKILKKIKERVNEYYFKLIQKILLSSAIYRD